MKFIIIAVTITLGTLSSATAKSLPNFIKVCKRNDPKLSKCVEDGIVGLRDNLKKGIPELEVPGLEPFKLAEMTIIHGGKENLTATVKDVEAYGGSDFKVNSLKVSQDALKYDFSFALPTLRLSGRYVVSGMIFKTSVKGDGPFSANLTDFGAEGSLQFKVDKVNGAEKLSVSKIDLKIKPGKGKVSFDSMTAGTNTGDVVNKIINDDFDKIVAELLPAVESALVTKFTEIWNNITKNFSFDELFPKA